MQQDLNNLKAIAKAFLQAASSHQVSEGYDLYVSEKFVHHNIHFKSDAHTLKAGMMQSAEMFPEKIFEVKQCIAENDKVMTYSHVRLTPDDKGFALMHLFRFENNKIVELWDIAQQIPESIANELGAF
ncbi:MAG TPA: ester cyclase [Bacteroidia bacterium]|jgi:predicted SnoaL-like aldol condensation-catalyzing enzyme|nr:ester cyclase [Bacteroidia bacterium]HQF27202.1 ester cyclase [Bacteroidia bacterium]HQK96494.1 ester cyclase [Bacteroidia bacterium]